ncbi:odorant receptor 4-like [Harpegnathos saltator]|uniref:odorant receptor 4-like n=1 Tax=Harpegnathos saltator TaxID=610380 RepID=UPI00094899BF|nr:odorant receptor 4-like [Harpegnathos saltator]
MSLNPRKMFANKNYESDIKYTIELNRFICRLLGIWPRMHAEAPFIENIKNILLILICYFLLCSELIPTILYVIIVEKRTRIRLKLISSVMFTTLAVLKYCSLVFNRNRMKSCLMRVQNDWRNVASANARDLMLNKSRTARNLLILCSAFMYMSGLYFRTVVPLSKGKFVTDQNITIRYLPCPSYFIFFDGRISPAYEIIFLIQFFSGFVKYTITVSICSLAALFVMHMCAQLEILMMLMNNLVNEQEVKNLNRKLAMTVEYQIRTRGFLQLVQNTLEHTSLLELLGCTMIVCLLGHDIITEWEDHNVVAVGSYLILLTSIGFNIFIFCFIGEQLSTKGEKLSMTVCTLDWYRLPDEKARALILIIAMSNIPTKLRAGKFVDLSIRTFGDVVKTAVTYFNLIRKVME